VCYNDKCFSVFCWRKKNELGQNGSLFVMKYNKRELISYGLHQNIWFIIIASVERPWILDFLFYLAGFRFSHLRFTWLPNAHTVLKKTWFVCLIFKQLIIINKCWNPSSAWFKIYLNVCLKAWYAILESVFVWGLKIILWYLRGAAFVARKCRIGILLRTRPVSDCHS